MRHPYPVHGPRWSWHFPLQLVCRCGLEARPCKVEQRYLGALTEVKDWQAEQRTRRGVL